MERWELSGRTIDIGQTFLVEYNAGIDEARQAWPKIQEWPRPLSWKPETAIEKYREQGYNSALAYREEALHPDCQWSIAELPDMSQAVEVPFSLDLDGVLVIGFIDQVLEWSDGTLTVRDLKSGKKDKPPIQLGVYRLAVNEIFGWDVRWGDYWTGKNNSSTGMVDLSRYTREFVTRQIHDLDKGVRAGVFLPNPSDFCKMCGVKEFCREMGSRYEESLVFERVSRVQPEVAAEPSDTLTV